MNQCANARAASLERCKRMLASPLSLPGFLLVLHSPPPFPFSLSNCCLSLTHTIAAAAAVFTFHFSLTNLFFSSHSFFFLAPSSIPCPAILFVHFNSLFVSSREPPPPVPLCSYRRPLVPSFLFSAFVLLQLSPTLYPLSYCF